MLRPDRLTIAFSNWLRVTLEDGDKYVDADASMNSRGILELALEDSSPAIPVYFIYPSSSHITLYVNSAELYRMYQFEYVLFSYEAILLTSDVFYHLIYYNMSEFRCILSSSDALLYHNNMCEL